MKQQILPRITFFLFLTLFIGIGSCKKGQKEPLIENTVTLDKSAVLPGDVITISTNFSLSFTSKALNVGNKQTILVATEDKKAMFIMPVLASGNYTIDFSSLGVSGTTSITVSAYQPITNPQTVFNNFKTEATDALQVVAALKNDPIAPLSTGDYTFMVDLTNQLNTIYATLTADEKLQAAYTLQKLSFSKSDMSTLDNSRDFYAVASAQPGHQIQSEPKSTQATDYADPGESLVRTGKKFVTSMSFTAASVGIGVIALEVPEPTGLSKFIAIAAGVTAGYHLSQSLTLVGRICTQLGIPTTINDPIFRSTNNTVNVNSSGVSTHAASNLILYNNAPVSLEVTSKFRTLTKSDASNTNELIKSIFQSEAQLASMYNALQSGFNKIKSWFSGKAPVLPGYVSKLQTSSQEKNFYLPANSLTVGNVSDATVNIATSVKDANVLLTASSSIGTTEKPVSFELTYKNASLGTLVKTTVNATYDPRITILGKWYLKSSIFIQNNGGGNNVIEKCDNLIPVKSWNFNSNGTVSLFDGYDFMDTWAFIGSNYGYTKASLGLFQGTKSYVLSADKQYVTIPWSPYPGPYSSGNLPSQNRIEIVTLTSTKLELRFPQYNSSAHNFGTVWSELITLTFSREP